MSEDIPDMTAEQAAFCLFGIKPSAIQDAFCVSGVKPSAEPTSAFSLGDKLATVRRRKDADEQTKLYDFMKEGKYVDVTLQFDDDHKITAHRCILASASGYFDSLLSNGMKESSEQTIKVVDVSSSASTTALEFIYTGKCSFTYDNFFDLLLLANMFELRDMEEALVQHLSDMRYVKGDFVDLNDNSTTRENLEHGIVDFFVDVWIFCRQYPVIVGSLNITDDSGRTVPFKEFVLDCLVTQSRTSLLLGSRDGALLASKLVTSENLLGLDFDSFMDFLDETELTEADASDAGKVAAAWIIRHLSGSEKQPDDNSLIESLLDHLRFDSVDLWELKSVWEKTPYLERVSELRESQLSRDLLILPDVLETEETAGFVCHDVATGENFYLDIPKELSQGSELYGSPKLVALQTSNPNLQSLLGQRGRQFYKTALFCVRGARQNQVDPKEKGKNTLSFSRHKYSFTRNPWGKDPFNKLAIHNTKYEDSEEAKAPLEQVEFLVPSLATSNDFLFVRLGHDFEEAPTEPSTESTCEKSSESGNTDKPLDRKRYTDKPSKNVAEVMHCSPKNRSERNLWDCRFPNFEVSGVGFYERTYSPGVVLFGNTFAKEGQPKKTSKTLLNAVKQSEGHPDGVCEYPLSVVSFDERIYVLASVPFTSKSKKGNLLLRVPHVMVYNPTGPRESQWKRLPTPSCPDLDYASLYLDQMRQKIVLVLVQKPPSQAPFSRLYNHEPWKNRQPNRGETRRPLNISERLVGRFALKLTNSDITSSAKKSVSEVWEPLPVTDALADFLALGSRLRGEVRITSALLNLRNLRPASLNRLPIGTGPDYHVEVAKNGGQSRAMSRMTPWLAHDQSPFHNVPAGTIENKMRSCCKKDASLYESLKKRRLEHPLMPNVPLVPSHPTVRYKSNRTYSDDDDSFDDSNDDYTDYEDYDDDIYGDGIYDDDIYEFQFGGVDREDRDAEYYMAMERAFNF